MRSVAGKTDPFLDTSSTERPAMYTPPMYTLRYTLRSPAETPLPAAFQTLVREGARLHAATRNKAGHTLAGHTPDEHRSAFPWFVALTDPRVPNFLTSVPHLPTGSAVILRHYDAPDREALAQHLRRLTQQHGVLLFIAGDEHLAQRCRANGLHLPTWKLETVTPATCRHWQQTYGWRLTAAVHTGTTLETACQLGVDAVLVSPIFPTKSHPDHPGIGVETLSRIISPARVPVLALGGINATTVPRLQGRGLWGIAGISGFWPLAQRT